MVLVIVDVVDEDSVLASLEMYCCDILRSYYEWFPGVHGQPSIYKHKGSWDQEVQVLVVRWVHWSLAWPTIAIP